MPSDLSNFLDALRGADYLERGDDPREHVYTEDEKPINVFSVQRDSNHVGGDQCPGAAQSVAIGEGYGYRGFIVEFFFDADGKLIGHSVWE